MELKLHIKQAIQYNLQGNAGYYAGVNPQSLVFTQGSLPSPRTWANYPNYQNQTHNISDLFKLKLTWTTDRAADGSQEPGGFHQQKSASGTITFVDEAYTLLKQWLIDDVSAPLNSVDVKIEHVGCGVYEDYCIKASDLRWCEDLTCQFDIVLKQKDEPLTCIKRTLIADNWQQWFQSTPGNGKKHPRFSYCNEIRPNAMLIMQWYFMSLTGLIIFVTFYVMAVVILAIWYGVILPVILLINAVVSFINSIGGNLNFINTNPQFIQDLQDAMAGGLLDSFGQFYLEAAGCGRLHPAPLIRDYITNVCDKCGVSVDGTTAPIFFASQITIQTSDPNRQFSNQGYITTNNPHYNACYFYAPIARGIRRLVDVSFWGATSLNTSEYYIPDNTPLLALDQFLDSLKPVYNADWRIKSINQGGQLIPWLYFQRKDFYRQQPGSYVFDLSVNAADRMKIVEGICYEWDGRTSPSYTEGLYSLDASDTCGNESRGQMNGFVEFARTDNNPTFAGRLDKMVQFGGTKFRLDGASKDYITDAMQVCLNGSIFGGIFLLGAMNSVVKPALNDYADYALLLKDETAVLPKILIWDTDTGFESARCVKPFAATSGQYGGVRPRVNPQYPSFTLGNVPVNLQWDDLFKHPPKTHVTGSGIIAFKPYGSYRAADLTGLFEYMNPALLVNYPMYFEPGYYDTLWDWFHWIDDPRLNPVLHQRWSVKLQLCCELLQRLQVFNNASASVLLQKLKLDQQYYTDGVITEITVSYDPSYEYGQYIELKGDR